MCKEKQSFLGVSRFATPLVQTSALIWCSGLHQHKNAFYIKINFIIFVIFVISGIEVAYRSKEEGELYKNYNLL